MPDAADDYPAIDEYLPWYASGIQPLRDDAVLASEKAVLEARLRDYFGRAMDWDALAAKHPGFDVTKSGYDGARVRTTLHGVGAAFETGRMVPFMFKPFDDRWLYWETRGKLLHRARKELLPYWRNVPSQVSLAAPQTPRRAGAVRPVPSRAVAGYHSLDPDARVFPLYAPDTAAAHDVADTEKLFEAGATAAPTMVAPEWVAAAQSVLGGTEQEAGEAVFYAIVAVTHSPEWLQTQPVEFDEFATAPLPADPHELRASADLGRRITDLFDTQAPVQGVTSGRIDPAAVEPRCA